ncbi:formimidoylglutamate deiminase [Reichenbachiella sp. 5M10]|uniref:formimidoylglutamate deiminase n=1 Tax=Reichenbachiella sp. 5M10 TaxID=1889772 RepID=UPI000C14CE34|nr:formimidoylglutamate deiminase [Reichenbachiella sp. 5M10]PIB34925.1 formimidoylglutamate deiminase [Reichenbachiella sp. 5M10]
MGEKYRFKGLLTDQGWVNDAQVRLDSQGTILSIAQGEKEGEYINGYALPGFQNSHSHAFQYAMAGLAEMHVPTQRNDDFWSWRKSMYEIALSISPDQLENIATMLYAEMLRHGYTAVAEFHYLHHDSQGKRYSQLSEMGERLVRAASRAGIHITLIPMFYQKGGFGKEANEGQRRFLSQNLDSYHLLLASSQHMVNQYSHAQLATGIHSLRAVSPDTVMRYCQEMDTSRPFHIHIAEQLQEVTDCLAYHGQRPVEWLLNHCTPNQQFHLVHATHLTPSETQRMAKSQVHAVLCPSTEGNLGDGLFPFAAYKEHGGRWSIGTDSHVGLNPLEELRILDYGQRTHTHSRETFVTLENGNSGLLALSQAWRSGKRAMGSSDEQFFQVGAPLDAVIMDAQSPLIACTHLDQLCNTFVYSSDASNILGTITHGEWQVKEGRHLKQEEITQNFIQSMQTLNIRRA